MGNTVEIVENSNYTITLDTNLVQNENNVVIELASPSILDIVTDNTVFAGNISISQVNGLQTALDNKQPSGIYASGIHNHTSSDIIDFDSSVSGLLPVTDIIGGSNIAISNNGSVYTVNVSGQLGLTAEQVDDRVNNLLVAGTGITLNYNDNDNTLTINTSGLQPSGSYSLVGHSHAASDITDFNTSVSGLLPVTNIVGGSNISVIPNGSEYTVSVSGNLGLTTEEVDDRVANLLVAGSGINLEYNDNTNTLQIHTSTNIINSSNLYLCENFR